MRRGLLIIDRGSREPEAHQEMRAITSQAAESGGYDYADFCFLEVLPPFIPDAMAKCLPQNLDTLTVVPYFLYPGKKVKAAVTSAIRYQKETATRILVAKPMSNHPVMVDLVDSRILSALAGAGYAADRQRTDVLIIGHGSKDKNAQMSINYVVERLRRSYRRVDRCFLEMEQPDIAAGVQKCQAHEPFVLVVVFYFLHEGAHVKRDVNADLVPALEKYPMPKVCVTKHIGADTRMVEFLLERATEVENAD